MPLQMPFAAPAFVGMPGGMELAIILLIAVVVFGIPLLLLLGGGGFVLSRLSDRDERIEELEREVATLREELDTERGDADESDEPRAEDER